ncbi:hypothetical protein PGT21_029039 [Puccinia graminis f. sp. tritici]|uniref:Uncharacterized protein n=1 Tax=Puccinia graminis f. sp. tritici TaxID=56615 RepID=A0A5B0Q776_PUCGR|nr:hypothetical protein PGT21_029039 [Puccinia graminis f. sp. tritici]
MKSKHPPHPGRQTTTHRMISSPMADYQFEKLIPASSLCPKAPQIGRSKCEPINYLLEPGDKKTNPNHDFPRHHYNHDHLRQAHDLLPDKENNPTLAIKLSYPWFSNET